MYLRFQRGRAHKDSSGVQLSAKNVLVLVTTYGQSAADSRSPEAQTVGSGEAFVYTTGRVIHGRWNRPAIDKPTSVVDDAGRPVFFSPGQTWIELPRAGGVTTVRWEPPWAEQPAETRPQILVCDISMPDEDGYAVLQRLRVWEASQELPPLPAIALTAHGRAEDRLQALRAGFQMHLVKPVEPLELALTIASLLDRRL